MRALHLIYLFSLFTAAYSSVVPSSTFSSSSIVKKLRLSQSLRPYGRRQTCAFVIPGDSLVETTFVDGTVNFISLYNFIITARVLLSWFPQAQAQPILRPIYTVTDPYLNVFRRLPLQFGGIDFSILPAFFLLNYFQGAVGSLAAEIPEELKGRRPNRRRIEMR